MRKRQSSITKAISPSRHIVSTPTLPTHRSTIPPLLAPLPLLKLARSDHPIDSLIRCKIATIETTQRTKRRGTAPRGRTLELGFVGLAQGTAKLVVFVVALTTNRAERRGTAPRGGRTGGWAIAIAAPLALELGFVGLGTAGLVEFVVALAAVSRSVVIMVVMAPATIVSLVAGFTALFAPFLVLVLRKGLWVR